MKDIHDFQRRMDYMNGVKGEQAEKPKFREKLETDVAKFLASGGKITEVPAPEYAPRQPCKNPKPYPKRPNPKPFRNHKYNTLLREWLTKVEGRARRLAEISDYNEVWLCQRRIGYFQLLLADYEILRKCVHGDIRHLEIKKSSQRMRLLVHGDIRHLEISSCS